MKDSLGDNQELVKEGSWPTHRTSISKVFAMSPSRKWQRTRVCVCVVLANTRNRSFEIFPRALTGTWDCFQTSSSVYVKLSRCNMMDKFCGAPRERDSDPAYLFFLVNVQIHQLCRASWYNQGTILSPFLWPLQFAKTRFCVVRGRQADEPPPPPSKYIFQKTHRPWRMSSRYLMQISDWAVSFPLSFIIYCPRKIHTSQQHNVNKFLRVESIQSSLFDEDAFLRSMKYRFSAVEV
jgi:hypothetical protein